MEGYPDFGLDGATRSQLRVRITSMGRSVLGVTYGPGVEAGAAAAAAASGPSDAAAAAPTVEASPGALCPHGLFSKRVPTAADIGAQGPLPLPEAQQLLAERCAAAFRESAEVEALLHLGGRRCLRDFDVVDVLPPARRRGFSGDGGAGPTGSAHLERQLLDLALTAGGSIASSGSGSSSRRGSSAAAAPPAQVLSCPLALAQPAEGGATRLSPYRACAFRRPRKGLFFPASDGAAAPSAASPSSRSSSSSSSALEADGSGGELGGLSLGAHASCHAWSPARVKFLTPAEASAVAAELTRRTASRASFSGRGMSFADAEGWEEATEGGGGGGSGSSSARSSGSSGGTGGGGSGAAAPSGKRLYAFWYEFAPRGVLGGEGAGGGGGAASFAAASPTSLLRFAPLAQLTAVAPLGAHTWPYVAGMKVDARRLGGRWGLATVVASDRYFVTLRVPRPVNDSSAGDPRALAALPALSASVRVDPRSAPARVGGAGAETLRVAAAEPGAGAGAGAGAGGASAEGSEEGGGGSSGSGWAAASGGAGGAHPLPLASAGEGFEVVPAQLWRHLVGRAGVHTKAGVDKAAAQLLPALLKDKGLESWLVGLQAPRAR